MRAGEERFHHLDVPQFLKHALGPNVTSTPGWILRYIYFDAAGGATEAHAEEIARCEWAVGSEPRFRAISYQQFVASLGPARDEAEDAYLKYLDDRYLGG